MKGKGKKKQKNPSNVFSMFEKSQARFHFVTQTNNLRNRRFRDRRMLGQSPFEFNARSQNP